MYVKSFYYYYDIIEKLACVHVRDLHILLHDIYILPVVLL